MVETSESRREHEFYRYYEPIRSLSEPGPRYCDVGDPQQVKLHQPCSSPDKALTAFCQLGALRLSARRAMLFFFDETSAYILAEATRTLSLQDDTKHDVEDSLWLGHTVTPRGFSICEHTVRMNISSLIETDDPPQLHVINDLVDSPQFCDRPFVKGGPKARFYAGMPITTPNGINIGAYCILDDKPRNGLERKDVIFLKEMANTIMTHLNMARAKDEQRRGLKMIDALSTFVDKASCIRERNDRVADPSAPSQMSGSRHASPVISPVHTPRIDVEPPTSTECSPVFANLAEKRQPKVLRSALASQRYDSSDVATLPEEKHGRSPNIQTAEPLVSTSSHPEHGSAIHDYGIKVLKHALISPSVHSIFQTAAQLIANATELDGAMFVDASVTTFGGLANRAGSENGNVSEISTSDDEKNSGSTPHATSKTCLILGASDKSSDFGITEGFLQSLLRRYKQGKIWCFDKHGNASSDEEYADGLASLENLNINSESMLASRKARRQEVRQREDQEIQRLLPGVRNFAIRGLWDDNSDRWYAACIVWTFSPLRVLSAGEMNYTSAFCEVIMAEVKRLEVQLENKAKTDFISSISHELRSPLHGILGTVECLQDQVSSISNSQELSQIETCGKTLLDIVDHLLDASLINSYKPKADGDFEETQNHRSKKLSLAPTPRMKGPVMRSLETNVNLAEITEETVDTVVYSFGCRKEKREIMNRDVLVMMQINDFNKPSWNVRLPTGAYRRIVINLVGNALKYTSAGFVSISLRAVEIPSNSNQKRFNAVLEVADSGRGMSKNYVQNSAFRAFSQEDSFVEGTGLGLNLVANILKQLGGKIEIESEKNVGTRVTVTLPLEHADGIRPSLAAPRKLPKALIGIAMRDYRPHGADSDSFTSNERSHALLSSSWEKTCAQLDFEVQYIHASGSSHTGLDIMMEEEAARLVSQHSQSANSLPISSKPLVIVSRTGQSERMMKSHPTFAASLTTGHVEYARSYWVSGLAKAIERCLSPELDRTITVDPINTAESSLSKLHSIIDQSDRLHPRIPADHSAPLSPPNRKIPSMKSLDFAPANSTPQPPTDPELCLLMVDDNPINLQILTTYAKKHGHRNISATNGEEAIQAYKDAYGPSQSTTSSHNPTKAVKYNIILMDINMPVKNGFEATRAIRAFENEHHLQPATIIALTGLGSAAAQQEAFGSGMDMFLTKPVRLKQLKRLLDGLRGRGDV